METDVDERIRGALVPGERLLWTGHPHRGLRLGLGPDLGCAAMVAFLLAFVGLALRGGIRNAAAGRPLVDVVAPLVMALGGLGMIVFLVVVEPLMRRRTAYALTDRRALVANRLVSRRVASLPLEAMTRVALHERGDGSGTISFEDFTRPCGEDDCTPAFTGIPDVRRVYGRIMEARVARRGHEGRQPA